MNQKTEKAPVDPELHRRVQELIAFKGGGYNEEAVADIIENALKILTDVKDTGDVRVIQTAVRELRYAYRLFAPYAQTRKVTIFGSARTAPEQTGISAGRRVRTEDRAGRLHGHHRRRPGHHAGRPRRRRAGKQLRRQHPPAVGTKRQPRHPRGQEARHVQIFLHPQAHLHPAFGRHRAVPRRLRHDGRRLRGASR